MTFNSLSPLSDPTLSGVVLRILLCSPYIWGVITKLIHFEATARRFSANFGMRFPRAAVAIAILVSLAGSAMFIMGWMPALAAVALAVFTMAATFIAYPFWSMVDAERRRTLDAFLEHVALSAAFLLLAWPLSQG